MNAETTIDLLKAEYIQLQSLIDSYDSRAFTIKAWSVTFSLAAVAGAFASDAAPIFLIAAFSAFLFWIVETHWNGIKSFHYSRIQEIEAFFRDETDMPPPLQILESWFYRFKNRQRIKFFSAMMSMHIALPHFPIILVSGVLYWAAATNLITL